jgi:ABC-type polysaccharide/polyol phosphate transport system ATPase subunit
MLKHLTGSTPSDERSAADHRQGPLLELENVGLAEVRLTPLSHTPAGRRGSNEVLNNLKSLVRVILRPQSVRDGLVTETVLEDISVALPAGISVGVLSTKPASRRALLDVAANMVSPDIGTVRRAGRLASLGQTWALASPFDSCRDNLELLARLLGAAKADYRKAIEAVERFDAKFRVLDLPLRRTPRWVLDDFALVMIAELQFDILVAPEATLPTFDAIKEYWGKYVQTVNKRDQLILLGSRRSANLLDIATHLLLLDGAKLVDFGPTEEITARHPDLIETALAAREHRSTMLLPFFDEEDDEEKDEEAELEIVDLTDPEEEAKPREAAEHSVEEDRYPLPVEVSAEDRTSTAIEIIRAGPGEYSRLLLPDGRDAVPRPDDERVPEACTALPVIYREGGGIVRLVVETKEADLWVYPAIYLRRRKTVLLRSSSPEIYVSSPGRIQFDVTLPPNFLQGWILSVSAVIGVINRTLDVEDVAIVQKLITFANIARTDREWQPLPDTEPLRHEPEARETQIEEDPRYRIVSLALEDVSGAPMARDAKGYHSAAAAERGFHIVFDVSVAAEPIKLIFVADLKWRHAIVLRLAPVERVLTPGTHRLTVAVPAGLLTSNSYELSVTAMEPEQVGRAEALGTGGELSALLRVSDGDRSQTKGLWRMPSALDMKLKWTQLGPDASAKTS